jgi:hypothetical protein
MLVMDEWRAIPGFEGLYSVSRSGEVRRDIPTRGFGGRARAGRVMSQKLCANGYRSVSLYPEQGKQQQIHVHRLVASAFLGVPPRGLVVNHKDGDKANNHLENLEYVTPSQNIRHAYKAGLARGLKGEANPMAVINDDTVRAILLLNDHHGWSIAALTRAFRLDTSRITRIIRGEIWNTE